MSLIVARKYGDKFVIVSDTRLDNPNNLNRIELVAPEHFSFIKTLIINPHVCISWAGEWKPAEEALRRCRTLNYQFTEILDYLLSINKSTNHETEFIACACLHPYLLYEIRDGGIRKTESAWIGSQEGYNVFQHGYHNAVNKEDALFNMQDAMKEVIQSNVTSVNGFVVSVSNLWQIFEYQSYIKTFMPARTLGPGHHVITYGTVAEGGYTIHFLPSHSPDVIAVHIPQNRMGIIYKLGNSGLLEPMVYKDLDEHEFTDITDKQHGIRPPYVISSLQTSYFERGNKQADKRNFKEALRLYQLGLNTDEDHLRALIWYNKGVCYHHLGQALEGVASFKEAVKYKPDMQAQVFKFISAFMKNPNKYHDQAR